jgi:hypothetical protein
MFLGSQVFDYWFDTSKFILEHYADGDLVNKDTPVTHVQAGPKALAVWDLRCQRCFDSNTHVINHVLLVLF